MNGHLLRRSLPLCLAITISHVFSLPLAGDVSEGITGAFDAAAGPMQTRTHWDTAPGLLWLDAAGNLSIWDNINLLDPGTKAPHRAFSEPLGRISLAEGVAATSKFAEASWVHATLQSTSTDGKRLTITTSRLLPAVLLDSNARAITVFGGKKSAMAGDLRRYMSVVDLGDAKRGLPPPVEIAGNPRYVLFPTAQGIQVRALEDRAALTRTSGDQQPPPPADDASKAPVPLLKPDDLAMLSENWFLVWYGAGSYLTLQDQPHPTGSYTDSYLDYLPPVRHGDIPMLFVLQHKPAQISVKPDGGLILAFAQEIGKVVMLPIFGHHFPRPEATEQWAVHPPADLAARCRQWHDRLGFFPVTVDEGYAVSPDGSRVTITERFRWETVRTEGDPRARFAPLPPMLGIAVRGGLPVTFSAPVQESGTFTNVGPVLGATGVESYSWSVDNLRRYLYPAQSVSAKTTTNEPVIQSLQARLNKLVDEMLAAGHLAPFISHQGLHGFFPSRPMWANPSELYTQLSWIFPLLDPERQKRVAEYCRREAATYPPLLAGQVGYDQGSRRERYAVEGYSIPSAYLTVPYWLTASMALPTPGKVPIENLYGLDAYVAMTGDLAHARAEWNKCRQILAFIFHDPDWATLTTGEIVSPGHGSGSVMSAWRYPTHGSYLINGMVSANRVLTGLVGYARLVDRLGDPKEAAYGRYLLAKAMVKRYALGRFNYSLYEGKIITVPEKPDWLLDHIQSIILVDGVYAVNPWTGPKHDLRCPIGMDQYGVMMGDHMNAFMATNPVFYDLCPEAGLLLGDFLRKETADYFLSLERADPQWYLIMGDAAVGREHAYAPESSIFFLFMARAWILQERPDVLHHFLDVQELAVGDLFYMNKLAQVIRAYQGSR